MSEIVKVWLANIANHTTSFESLSFEIIWAIFHIKPAAQFSKDGIIVYGIVQGKRIEFHLSSTKRGYFPSQIVVDNIPFRATELEEAINAFYA